MLCYLGWFNLSLGSYIVSLLIAYDCFLNDIVTAKSAELEVLYNRMYEHYKAPSEAGASKLETVPLHEALKTQE